MLLPGAYRSISAELRLHHLAVAAVSQAPALSDLEGAAGATEGGAFKVRKVVIGGISTGCRLLTSAKMRRSCWGGEVPQEA